MAHPGLPVAVALLAVPVAVLLFVVALVLRYGRRHADEVPPPALPPPPRLPALPAAHEEPYGGRFPYIPDEHWRVN